MVHWMYYVLRMYDMQLKNRRQFKTAFIKIEMNFIFSIQINQ